jgi:nucleotide-binding universal stress UspA family protein
MYKSILLPLDGSAMAEQVLPYAVAQAEHFQAELILMKILEPVERSISLPPGETSRAEKVTSKLASEY